MRDLIHGRAVPAFGSPGRAAAVSLILLCLGGCRPDKGDAAATRPGQEPPLPPPQLRSEVTRRQALPPPAALAELRPAAVLRPDERQLVYPLTSPALLRVDELDGSKLATLVEAEAGRGQIVVIDRRRGVILDGTRIADGPLGRGATYELYVLPPGGVVNEATVTRIRPETERERRDRAEAERAATPAAPPATRPNEQ